MTGSTVEGENIETGVEPDKERRDRRPSGLLAVVLLLLLLLACSLVTVRTWRTMGPQKARFIATNAQCLQCHSELIPDFDRASVHDPFAKKDCESCHTPHGRKVTVGLTAQAGQVIRQTVSAMRWLPFRWWFAAFGEESLSVEQAGGVTSSRSEAQVRGPKSKLVMEEQDLCWMCHGDLGAKMAEQHRHQPFEAGKCTNCHNPHASDYSALLTQAPNELCFTCHPIGEELSRMQSHPPAKAGWCTNCHDPHASEFEGIIVARQRELCFRCHPSVAMKESMAVQHVPFFNDNCTGCHEPHGSDNLPLLVEEQPNLCYECHSAIADQFAQASHHPVGLNLPCSGCHEPHAAQYEGLLEARDNQFCYRCHGEFEEKFAVSEHDESLCIGCHTPHGSAFAPILRNSNPDLCLGCHESRHYDGTTEHAVRNNHPVRPSSYDVNARENLTCTTSCHNPHGSDLNNMLRYFDAETDGACLMCHATAAGPIVGIDF